MDFELTPELKEFHSKVTAFAAEEVAPLAQIIDRTGCIPPEVLAKAAELGLFGIPFPREYGGLGLGYLGLALAVEELARVCASTALVVASHTALAAEAVRLFGTEEQKNRYLLPLARGEMLGAFAVTEPGAGSDLTCMTTQAVLVGDRWVINGRKAFITNADLAGVVVVGAVTEEDGRAKERQSLFLVPADAPGFTVGSKYDKLGLRGASTVEIFFDNCEVPANALLGERGLGYFHALEVIDRGRITIAALATGIGRACFEHSLSYAKKRVQFGQPLAKFQAVRFKLADMATEIELARLAFLRAAWLHDRGLPFKKEAAMAKLFASEAATKAASYAVQIHGGAAYTKEHPVEQFFRDAKLMEIAEGTSEIMRLVIAKQLGC